MKGYYSLACLAVLLAVQATVTDAQSADCGIYADSLAHPTDCTKYYKITMHSCPDGQLYNKDTKKCDLPENTSCGAQETTPQEVWTTTLLPDTTVVPQTTPEPITTTDLPITTTPEPTTTTEEPQTTPEPTTTTVVPITTTPEPTTTTEEPQTTPEPTTTTEEPSPTTAPQETTVIMSTLAPTTPSEPPVEPTTEPPTEPPTETPTETPTTTPTTTTTTTTTTPTTTTPTTTTPTTTTPTTTTTAATTTPAPELPYLTCPAVDDPNNKIRYAHETNCAYYYLCSNGKTQLYTCLAGNHFNPLQKTCNPINQAGCDRCPDVPVANVVVRLPHETVCQYYYRCDEAGGSSQLYTCTTGLQFSRAERICKSKSEAFCTLLITDEQP